MTFEKRIRYNYLPCDKEDSAVWHCRCDKKRRVTGAGNQALSLVVCFCYLPLTTASVLCQLHVKWVWSTAKLSVMEILRFLGCFIVTKVCGTYQTLKVLIRKMHPNFDNVRILRRIFILITVYCRNYLNYSNYSIFANNLLTGIFHIFLELNYWVFNRLYFDFFFNKN